MRIPLLENSFTSQSRDIDPSFTCNLFPEIAPEGSKSQIALISRPGLTLQATMAGISRGSYVFSGIQYHVIGNQVWSYTNANNLIDGGTASSQSNGILDGGSASTTSSGTVSGGGAAPLTGTLTNLTSLYSWPNLATSSGPVTFSDNGISPAGGNQMAICDGANLYVIDVNPTIFVNINGDGVAPDGSPSATLIPTVSGGQITALNIPSGLAYSGSGYTNATITIVGGNPSSVATATPVLQGGSLNTIDVTIPGSNYLTPPTVTIGAPTGSGGIQATATISQNQIYNGQIQEITITNAGTGYITAPTITISGNGSAQATAVLNAGGITGATMVTNGAGYGTPSFLQIKNSGTTATGTVTLGSASVYQINVTAQGAGYLTTPSLTISGGSGVGAAATPILAGGSGAVAVVTYVSGSVSSKYVSMVQSGTGYTAAPIVTFYGGGGTGAAGTAIISGVVSGVQLTSTGFYNKSQLPSVTFQGGGGSGATAHVVQGPTDGNGNGALASIVIDNGGQGYTSAPTVIIGSASGVVTGTTTAFNGDTNTTLTTVNTYNAVTATGTAAISSGVVGINITNAGSGYTSPPNIQFLNSIQQIGVLAGGYDYTSAPTITLPSIVSKISSPSVTGTYTVAPTVVIAAPAGINPVTATAQYFITGSLMQVVVTNGGSGYSSTNPPVANITGGNGTGGTTGTATTVNAAGQVTGITLTANNSYGYTVAPTIVFSNTQGVGATAIVLLATADTIMITNPGSGYLTTPSVTISGGTGGSATATATISGATATAVLNYPVQNIVMTNTGSHYTDVPEVTIYDPQGTGAVAVANVNEGMVTSVWVTEVGQNYTPGSTTVTIAAPSTLQFPAAVPAGQAAPGITSINQISSFGILSQVGAIFQTSALADFTIWPGLDFSAKYNTNDALVSVGIGNINGYLALIGQATVELWAISPESEPPFVYSSTINVGTSALQSVVAMDNTIYMLANANNNGKPEFMGIARYNGTGFETVSPVDVNSQIGAMTTISDATAYSYTRKGHLFYVISFPTGNKTWVYDVSTKKGHWRSSWTGNKYTQQRELPQYYCTYNGQSYVTDYSNGNLYTFDDTNFTDNGSPMARLRITQPIFDKDDLNFIQHDLLEIDMGTNVANPKVSNPQAILSWSDDGANNWTQDYPSAIGNSSWGNRLRFTARMLGLSKKRSYRIVVTDAVPVTLIAGYLTGSKLDI